MSFLLSRRKVFLLFLIASIAISLSSKNLLSASAIAKPSFLKAARTISLSFLKCVGRFSNSNPFFLTIFKASDLVIIFFLQKMTSIILELSSSSSLSDSFLNSFSERYSGVCFFSLSVTMDSFIHFLKKVFQ